MQPQNTEGNETLQSQNAEGRDSLHSQKVWYCQWNKLRESIQSSDAHIIAAEVDEIMNNDTLQPLEEDILVNDATNSKQDELVKPPEVKDLENATKVEKNNEHLQPLKYDITSYLVWGRSYRVPGCGRTTLPPGVNVSLSRDALGWP